MELTNGYHKPRKKGLKAIIIGAGSTIYDKNHLELLAQTSFDGYVMPCDRILKYALEQGITPEKFPKYYTATINDLVITHNKWNIMELFFNHQIIRNHAKNIKCFLSSRVHPRQKDYLIDMGISIEGYYDPCDKIRAYPIPTAQKIDKLQDCEDVSITLWNLARKVFHCSDIALLGVDLSYSKYDTVLFNGKNPSRDKTLSCILKLLKQAEDVRTYNCTEGGRLYGPGITNSILKDFLKS